MISKEESKKKKKKKIKGCKTFCFGNAGGALFWRKRVFIYFLGLNWIG
jgi:hypothetical protein